ncbi:hypothetical protein, partial [Pedobacter sp. ASV28]|uniref:hypothetical protein n=1 Tax=Pedobacter sp. ASV28 TaxID=2795123 RepID=UPI0018EE342E
MKHFSKQKHLSLGLLCIFFIIISCNKNIPLETNPPKQEAGKLTNNEAFIEQKQKLYPADKQGNILNEKQIKELKSRASTMALCDGYIIDG